VLNKNVGIYEAHTLFRLGVSRCRTRVVSNTYTDTYNYIKLRDFVKLLAVSAFVSCVCVSIRAS